MTKGAEGIEQRPGGNPQPGFVVRIGARADAVLPATRQRSRSTSRSPFPGNMREEPTWDRSTLSLPPSGRTTKISPGTRQLLISAGWAATAKEWFPCFAIAARTNNLPAGQSPRRKRVRIAHPDIADVDSLYVKSAPEENTTPPSTTGR